IALEIAGNDIGGINIDDPGAIVFKSGGNLKILKIVGIVFVLIIGFAKIEVSHQIIQGIARYIHIDIPFKNGDAIIYDLRSEEHTSELQSRENLVCRLLLEK